MAKINRKNAREHIAELLKDYEVKIRQDGTGGIDNYIEMPEAEFDEVVKTILDNCTKELRYYLRRYTKKYTIAWLEDAPGGRISTYGTDFAFVKFT